jgi:hypothetical protein
MMDSIDGSTLVALCNNKSPFVVFDGFFYMYLLNIVAITGDHKYFPILILGKHQCHFSPLKNLHCHTPDSCYRDNNVSNSQQSKYNVWLELSNTDGVHRQQYDRPPENGGTAVTKNKTQ